MDWRFDLSSVRDIMEHDSGYAVELKRIKQNVYRIILTYRFRVLEKCNVRGRLLAKATAEEMLKKRTQ